MVAPAAERARIEAALRRFGIAPEPVSIRASGNGIVFRFPDPTAARDVLRDRGRFRQGPLGILHGAQVEGLDTEFRSCRKGPEYSLHVVLGRTGLVYADLDRFNPYQNATGLLLHGLLELAPHLVRTVLSFSTGVARRRRRHFSLDPGTGSRVHTVGR
jgi:hypothetical protein